MSSPYADVPPERWAQVTEELVRAHPLSARELVEITLNCWKGLFKSRIGARQLILGKDILPKPQVMGELLHEVIPIEVARRYPRIWRSEQSAADKDLVCLSDPRFSTEIKTSSSIGGVYGNRSYAQAGLSLKKAKSGYYLVINFESFRGAGGDPRIRRIRFGWLDHTDWRGQAAQTGQQASLTPQTRTAKLLTIYPTVVE